MEEKNKNQEHGKSVLRLSINGKHYEWHQEYITGAEIRKLGNIPPFDEIFLAIKKPWEDELIPNEKQINLARPEIEHFYSKETEAIILVNGTPREWVKSKISFKEVIILAYSEYIDNPTMVYVVAYEDGPKKNPEGSMFPNQEVFVKNKMIFNAAGNFKS